MMLVPTSKWKTKIQFPGTSPFLVSGIFMFSRLRIWEAGTNLRNVGKIPRDYTAQHPRRLASSFLSKHLVPHPCRERLVLGAVVEDILLQWKLRCVDSFGPGTCTRFYQLQSPLIQCGGQPPVKPINQPYIQKSVVKWRQNLLDFIE